MTYIALAFTAVFIHRLTVDEVTKLSAVLFTPLATLTGTAMAFWFKEKRMTYDDSNPTFEAFVETLKTDCEVCGGIPGFVPLEDDAVLEVLCEAECDEDQAQCPLLSYQAFYPEAFFLMGSTGSKDTGSSSSA